jgi:hypothetical protein
LLRDVVGKKGNVYVLEEKVKDGDGKRWCITQRGEPRHLKSIGTVNIADSDEEIGRRFLRRPSK